MMFDILKLPKLPPGICCGATHVLRLQVKLVWTTGTSPRDDIMTPHTDTPQVGQCAGSSNTRWSCLFYCGKYDNRWLCTGPSLLPTVIFSQAQVLKFLIMNVVCNMCHGVLLQNSCILSEVGRLKLACKDMTPSFPFTPEHQLRRGLCTLQESTGCVE